MSLNNIKKSIGRNKQRLAELTAIIKEQEELERSQENAEIVKIVRKKMTYDEFIEMWNELMGDEKESNNHPASPDAKVPTNPNGEQNGIMTERTENDEQEAIN